MRLGETVDAYVRPRWARWLGELSAAGLTADHLRTDADNRDSAPRDTFALWVKAESTVTAKKALFVGQRVAADATLKQHGDGLVSLYAAGYCNAAAACLQVIIDGALERYPHRRKVARQGGPDWAATPVRELQQALIIAVHLPYALAHIDGISDALIAPQKRAEGLVAVLHWHTDALTSMTLDAPWAACVPKGSALQTPPHDVTLADQQALAYSNFLNRLSRRAQHDPILQLHLSTLRERVDDYQRAAFHVPHHQPTLVKEQTPYDRP